MPDGFGPESIEEFFIGKAYRKADSSRFTQDSPILPDVFVHYGMADPDERLDLLLTPDWSKAPGQVAEELKAWLGDDADSAPDAGTIAPAPSNARADIAHNQSVVAARLTFEELVCNVLPLSKWWQRSLVSIDGGPVAACADPQLERVIRRELEAGLRKAMLDDWAGDGAMRRQEKLVSEGATRHWLIKQEMIWAARLFWLVRHGVEEPPKPKQAKQEAGKLAGAITAYFLRLVARIARRQEERSCAPTGSWVYSVNRNREINVAMLDSLATTKADAAVRTFAMKGRGIRWAVIDTGIDARHIAFRQIGDDGVPHELPFGFEESSARVRIKATYDFSNIRAHLSGIQGRALKSKSGRLLDWEKMEEVLGDKLRVPHTREAYQAPALSHGTHVAGILAADWRVTAEAADPLGPPPPAGAAAEPFTGMCPEIELYDLRVFKDDGGGDEFAVMSALQFVRSLNQRHDTLEVHGVNLSLAMQHEVSNYACGRSPVCEECTRLVGNGVVVVAAAGNDGRSIHTTPQGARQEGYRTVSIADPGNTEAIITVGSTHRREPHTYGVSYFSSRGPTGDGRMKPDLVAPGEKILSTVPGDRKALQDGTSQAAPHVSGAAALLMARHREMIGQPDRVKRVLMETATDLGRERHYQGAGLVDVMRAIASL